LAAKSLERPDDDGRIVHLRHTSTINPEKLVNLSPVCSEIIGLQWIGENKERRKTASEIRNIIACLAGIVGRSDDEHNDV